MLVVLSPSKTIDCTRNSPTAEFTVSVYSRDADHIVDLLKKYKVDELKQLMGISGALARLNFERFQAWNSNISGHEAKQAIIAFSGDVYTGLDASSLTGDLLIASQKKLRILSGLYGVLKPLDLIRPYRLEMATDLAIGGFKNLYSFWGEKITNEIQSALKKSGSNYLVNLASGEYFKTIDYKKLQTKIIQPEFKEFRSGGYQTVILYTKMARGMMARFILENSISQPEEIKAFDSGGYLFNPRVSMGGRMVFTRGD